MTDIVPFEASEARVRALDARMRERLGDSLRYILVEAAPHLRTSPAVEAFLDYLEEGPVAPLAFAAYRELVLALDRGDIDEADRALSFIAAEGRHAGGPELVLLQDPETDLKSDLYHRLIDTDPELPFRILPPPADVAETCRARIASALDLVDRGAPELGAELKTMLRQIVLAVGPDDPDAMTFEGASSFLLWGAILLNAALQRTTLDMVQAIVHEAAHNLLFGLSADGPLVLNDDEERFSSPLRADPRPMDGIYHATFVCARMYYGLDRLAQSRVLGAAEMDEAQRAMRSHAQAFVQGTEVIERHGHLTPLGRAVLDGARHYMEAARVLS